MQTNVSPQAAGRALRACVSTFAREPETSEKERPIETSVCRPLNLFPNLAKTDKENRIRTVKVPQPKVKRYYVQLPSSQLA